jgi:FdhE protein
METLRERSQQLKEKRPGYAAILDFYVQVRELQAASRASVRVDPMKGKKERRGLPGQGGFPLVEKEDFPIDLEASIDLFRYLCQLGSTANAHMGEQVEKIKEALRGTQTDLEKLLSGAGKAETIEQVAEDQGLDKQVLSFLIQNSIQPSIETGREQLRGAIDPEMWRRNHCPICGSLPALNLLKRDGGMRYSLCFYCGFEWRIDRLSCSVCGNKDQGFLQYFYGEGEEACRIDLCDQCHHYIKTIDYRILEASDPCLEDLATLHLDVLAAQKGYRRPVPNPWST